MSGASCAIISAAMIMLISAINPGLAKAGVLIEQSISVGNRTAPGSPRTRTLMLQGNKEKFRLPNGVSVIIDADDRTVMLVDDKHKTFSELPLRIVVGTSFDPNRDLYLAFKNTNRDRELIGFKCQDYTAERVNGPLLAATTACFSTDATGAGDFDHFIKAIVHDSGRLAGASIPAGLPLAIESNRGVNTSFVPPNVSKEEALRFQKQISHAPTQVTRVEVTKIKSVKLSPDTFSAPAGYSRRGTAPD